MKILLDECVDQRLAGDFVGHWVSTVRKMGWQSRKNGELMELAAEQFEVFVTTDRNLSYQQNLSSHAIALLVLKAPSNRLADLRPIIPAVLKVLPFLKPGEVREMGI